MGAVESVERGPQVTVSAPEKEGETGIYRHIDAKDGLIEYLSEDTRTLYDAFRKTVKLNGSKPYLGTRTGKGGEGPFAFKTYQQVSDAADQLAAGMIQLGLTPSESFVGIYSLNREEWLVTMHAADSQSLPLCPLYDTLGAEVVEFIVNEAELTNIFTSGNHVASLIEAKTNCSSLKTIVTFDAVDEETLTAAEGAGLKLVTFAEVLKMGKENPVDHTPPKPEDLQTVCYTSGTTGNPKGVLLTHANFIAEFAGLNYRLTLSPTDVHISYLPLAHSFERVVIGMMCVSGCAVGFYRGDVKKLFDDIAELKPTLFVSVPRLYNRLYDKVTAAIAQGSSFKQSLFNTAYEAKVEGLKEGYLTHALYDRMIFKNIQAKLGGRIRVMVTASAPLADKIMTFLRVCFAVPVLEGYGQTENCGGLTTTMTWQTDVGNVGVPVRSIELKLVSVPEQDYLVTDKPYPRGEVCYRGPITTSGYYKNKKKTDELIIDGWHHTGDVGLIYPDGNLKIIDRAKNIFKLSQGEYVAPEKLENVFVQSKWVAQAFVYGNSLKSVLVGVVVPDFEVLTPWAKENGKSTDEAELCKDPEIVKMILESMNAKGKENKLRGFEYLRALTLSAEQFSVSNQTLTPTFKLKRPQAFKLYEDAINTMYADKD